MPKHTPHLDHTPFIVKPGSKVRLKDFSTKPTGEWKNKRDAKESLLEDVSALTDAQERLWASKDCSVLIILQAMDAAGKDGAIKHVMSAVNPQGCSVQAFGPPTDEERLHHFLWRPVRFLPERGRISIFNRSYYEEVLVVRVHPAWLEKQWTPHSLRDKPLEDRWKARYKEINEFEHRLTRHGLVIIKFFLYLSREEQRDRLLARLDDPRKNWKFSESDVKERAFWDSYQKAYEDVLGATSTDDAPWYVIPADKKWFSRAAIADVIAHRIDRLDLDFPKPEPGFEKRVPEYKRALGAE